MISFNQIPVTIRTPGQYIEFDNTRALGGLPAINHKILVIGQRLTAGTVAELIATQVTSADQAEQFFGRGSMLSAMLKQLKAVNRWTECWAIAIDDLDAGVAAAGEIAFSGSPTVAGTLNLMIAGMRVRVGIASGATAAAIATAVAAAINAQTDLPVTAAVDGVVTTQVNVTARHKGLTGNDIDIRLNYYVGEATPAGLTVAITAMADGAGNPDIDDVIAAIGDTQYHTIIMPYTDAPNLTSLETELADRWGPMRQLEGRAYAGASGSHATLTTLGESRNSPHVTTVGAFKSPTPPWLWAAAWGGTIAYYGNIDPARPFQTLPLPGLLPPAEADRFTQEERNLLLFDGISTFLVDAGGVVLIERAITMYRLNAYSIADISYLNVNTMLTLAYLRYSVRARIAQKFPRHKLADDGTNFGPGQAIVTPNVIRGELIALFSQWEEAGLAENIEQFKADLIVERNQSDPDRIDALIPPDVINQLRVFAGQIQFRL